MVIRESTPPEDIAFISDQTVEKLTHGLIAHYLPDLQDSKQALQELTYVIVVSYKQSVIACLNLVHTYVLFFSTDKTK